MLTAVLGTAAAGVVASPATAEQTGTSAAPPPADELFGVSCVSPKNCVAVGLDQNAYANRGGPLTETWNGKTWKIVTMKLPAAAISGQLSSVSCTSATAWVAVGLYLNSSDTGSRSPRPVTARQGRQARCRHSRAAPASSSTVCRAWRRRVASRSVNTSRRLVPTRSPNRGMAASGPRPSLRCRGSWSVISTECHADRRRAVCAKIA